jgi:solute carrier family 25 (peroxisomal adenine nucleotide transporter), member 17
VTQGIVPTLVMVANPTVQYALYEWLTNLWRRRQPMTARKQPLGSLSIFLLSALAKLGATLATYPLLVVKNRIQVCVYV